MRLLCPLLLLIWLSSTAARLGGEDGKERHSPRYLKAPEASRIDHEYIVRLKTPHAKSLFKTLMEQHPGAEIIHEYTSVYWAIAVKGIPSRAMQDLANDNEDVILSVEESQVMHTVNNVATWGLDRIDQRRKKLNNKYKTPDNLNGAGVDVYIIDTGVKITHEEFQGRVVQGFDATGEGKGQDGHGHGTHVASTAAGTIYGVAKGATIVPVRVLGSDGSGSLSDVIAGLDWVKQQHEVKGKGALSVANLSLGGGFSQYQNDAIKSLVDAGIVVVVAAGNDNMDACYVSPASEPSAITVGATAMGDDRSSFSNYGTCVDLFAPGSSITAAGVSSNTATAKYSGTSMASPHVAGAAALLLQADPSKTGRAAADTLLAMATTGRVRDPGSGSPNTLLYIGGIASTGPPTEPDPTEQDPTPGSAQISLYIKYDDYSEQTSFILRKREKRSKWVTVEKERTGKNIKDKTYLMTLDDGDYKFSIRDSNKDGMCCEHGQGSYTLTDVSNNNYVFATGGNFKRSDTTTFTVSGGYVVGGPTPSSSVSLTMTVKYDYFYHETSFSLSKKIKRKKFKKLYTEDAPSTNPSGPNEVPITLSDGTYIFGVADAWGDGGGEYSLEANGTQFASGPVLGSGETIKFKVSGGSVTLL